MISHTLRFKVSRVRDRFKPAVPAHHSRASSTPPVLRARGLSPRVRGNLRVANVQSAVLGSIPACAGKPLCHYDSIGEASSLCMHPGSRHNNVMLGRLPAPVYFGRNIAS